jgi:hypothetical protein
MIVSSVIKSFFVSFTKLRIDVITVLFHVSCTVERPLTDIFLITIKLPQLFKGCHDENKDKS